MDISEALAAVSDEMTARDLIGGPPRIFTITDVDQVVREKKKVVRLRLAEFDRPWLASKGMARVMSDAWGRETREWAGKQVELYGDPDVYFGPEKRGGIRISRLSHIKQAQTSLVNPRGGRGSTWTVKPLPTDAPATDVEPLTEDAIACCTDLEQLRAWYREHPAQREAILARKAELEADPS
jgi:hypothetical protein